MKTNSFIVTITFRVGYCSKHNNKTYVYTVTGSPAALKRFKKLQGTFYRESDNKEPLYFTTRYHGTTVDLEISSSKVLDLDNPPYTEMITVYTYTPLFR